MFLILDRNREWWAKAGPPGSGARLTFGASRVIFQYFPGKGLQFHPLANFGRLNGYWLGRKNSRPALDGGGPRAPSAWSATATWPGSTTSSSAEGARRGCPGWRRAPRCRRSRGPASGSPTPASRRSRAAALGAFEQRTPRGVRVPQANGDWYALYSFAPKLYVLNGHLQAVNGLRTDAELTGDPAVLERFQAGDAAARQRIASFDTGAWSLYSRPSWVPGAEANLNYHTLNRDFARNLCKGTGDPAYCGAADAFTRYLKEDPTLDPQRAVPSPAVGGKGVRFKFRLSKIGRVGRDRAVRRTDVPVHERLIFARRSLHPLGPAPAAQRAHVRVHALRTRPCGQFVLDDRRSASEGAAPPVERLRRA